MRYIETNLVLLKTYHMDFGEGQCSKKRQEELDRTVFSQDIQPYVQYSLNKKKRWEVEAAVKMLGELQKMYNDMDVVVLERIDFRGAPFFSELFLIKICVFFFKISKYKTFSGAPFPRQLL